MYLQAFFIKKHKKICILSILSVQYSCEYIGGKSFMATLAENIKFYRKQQGLTQKDLAKKLNMAPTAISAWEVGRNKPLMDNIEQMAQLFNIKKSELLGDDLNNLEESEPIDLREALKMTAAFNGDEFDDYQIGIIESFINQVKQPKK